MTASVAVPNLVEAVSLVNTTELFTSWIDVHEFERTTFFLDAVRTGAPGDLTVTVEVSMDPASLLNKTTPESGLVSGDYDKLIDKAGADAPVPSIIVSAASAFRVFSFSPEDTIRSFRVGYVGAGISAGSATWAVSLSYAASARG
jgi:hypothetical protein|tara:strand:+ start:363 stop:797 length:435 start_codon:yes stop_codon:yes gene_type:complete